MQEQKSVFYRNKSARRQAKRETESFSREMAGRANNNYKVSRGGADKNGSALKTATSRLNKILSQDDQLGNWLLTDTPEKRLLVAVIERAFRDLIKLHKIKRGDLDITNNEDCNITASNPIHWIESDSMDPFSFCWMLQQVTSRDEYEQGALRRLRAVAKEIQAGKRIKFYIMQP